MTLARTVGDAQFNLALCDDSQMMKVLSQVGNNLALEVVHHPRLLRQVSQ